MKFFIQDVLASTENSVDGLAHLEDEQYLCPTESGYVQPLRALNAYGKWRIIVNHVKAHYETLSQTARQVRTDTAQLTHYFFWLFEVFS